MEINREFWNENFFEDEFPNWQCPICRNGVLFANQSNLTITETKEYLALKGMPIYEILEIDPENRFFGHLVCSNPKCDEKVSVVGRSRLGMAPLYVEGKHLIKSGNEILQGLTNIYYPLFFDPALHIIELHDYYPWEVNFNLEQGFSLYWIDKSACANKIRTAVELILDDLRIRKRAKNNRKIKLSLHHRIELYGEKKPDIANLLMAIKWLGNYGSHTGELDQEDILDGLDMLQLALNKIYLKSIERIEQLSKTIRRKKGPA